MRKVIISVLILIMVLGPSFSGLSVDKLGIKKAEAADPACTQPNTKSAWNLTVNNTLGKLTKKNFAVRYLLAATSDVFVENGSYEFKALKSGVSDFIKAPGMGGGNDHVFHISRCNTPAHFIGYNVNKNGNGTVGSKDGKFSIPDQGADSGKKYTYYIYLQVKYNNQNYLIEADTVQYVPNSDQQDKNEIGLLGIEDKGECKGSSKGTPGCRRLKFNVVLSGKNLLSENALICRITVYQLKAGGGTNKDKSNHEASAVFTQAAGGGSVGLTHYQSRDDKCLYKATTPSLSQELEFVLHKDNATNPKNLNYFFAGVEYQQVGEKQTTHFGVSSKVRSIAATFDSSGNVTTATPNQNEDNTDAISGPTGGGDATNDTTCPLMNNNSGWIYRTFVGTPMCGALNIMINIAVGFADWTINKLFVPALGIQYGGG